MQRIKPFKLQDLPRKEAHFCLHTVHFIEDLEFSLKDKKLIVAFSAGADSMAVLVLLSLLREKYNLELFAVHIDHSLREESAQEAEYALSVCNNLNIECVVIKEDVNALAKTWQKGIEESARIVRYKHFEEQRSLRNFDYIALGHHLNDLAEDVLMRQMRGTSLDGSVGMSALDGKRHIIRPFLLTEKKKLVEFLNTCNISWIEDSSNSSDDYMRNRVRHTVLPLFLKENPSYLKNVRSNWLQGQSDKQFWSKRISTFIPSDSSEIKHKLTLNRQQIIKEEKAIRLRVLAEALRRIGSQPQSEVLFKLDDLMCLNESNKALSVNNNVSVTIKRDIIFFEKSEIKD